MAKKADAHSADSPVSRRLRQGIETIMRRWESRVRSELAAAQHQDSPALRNTLPGFLASLADALIPGGRGFKLIQDTGIVQEHGGQRSALPRYHLEHIVLEYRILQELIFEVLEEEGNVDAASRRLIQNCILQAVSDSITEFTRVHQDLRSQFILTLTHDLRNPLSANRACADLIIRNPQNSEKHVTLAHRIRQNIERMDTMIQNLLDGSLIQVGERLALELAECDCKQLIKDTIAELESVHGDRFVLSFPDEEVKGYWSREGLRRVLENLAMNAIKYGYQSTPVTVGLSQTEQEVTLIVHNQGNVISPEDMATLFDPFRRTKSAFEGSRKGWGLGLTLVRGVAEAHGGRVVVESAAGEGTLFKVMLPRDSRPFQRQERTL
jgi:signal transduction histidine kinase